jgi:hypothetical protein
MTKEQQLVHTAVEELLRLANRHKVVICGFALAGDPEPMVVNFGNCTDAHKLELYESLVKLCDDKRAKGQSIDSMVSEVH